MQNPSVLILMHVDGGYGAFCERSPDAYTAKPRCPGSYAGLHNQCEEDKWKISR